MTLKEKINIANIKKALRNNGFHVSDNFVPGAIHVYREYRIYPKANTRDDGNTVAFTFEINPKLSAKEMIDYISSCMGEVETEKELVTNHCRDLVNKEEFENASSEMKMAHMHAIVECRNAVNANIFKAFEILCK